jgi:ketosteroid isomerase-like protein
MGPPGSRSYASLVTGWREEAMEGQAVKDQTATEQAARNAELLREGYAAFGRGDLASVQEVFDPNVVWHAYNLGQLGGDHHGWAEVQDFFVRTAQLTGGTFHIEVEEILANENSVAAIVYSRGQRDGTALNSRQIHQYRIVDGKVMEVWQHVGDGKAAEAFWS